MNKLLMLCALALPLAACDPNVETAKVQGATVANAAFLVFQNEDLERYNALFNLAAEYSYMAANAFDYETGLLGTPAGQSYLNQIISSCALGVIDKNGVLRQEWRGVKVPGHVDAVLAAAQALDKA